MDIVAAQLLLPPDFKEGQTSYEGYKKELAIWSKFLGEPTREGPIVFRSLQNNYKAKNAILELTADEIASDKGLKLILAKLDAIYATDENVRIITSLEKFEGWTRGYGRSLIL